jgi:hypothetical protein
VDQSKTQVRSESLESGSVKPTPAPTAVRPDVQNTPFTFGPESGFFSQAVRRVPIHRRSLGTGERLPSPTIEDEAVSGPVVVFREGAD